MNYGDQERQILAYMKKGFVGEKQFDKFYEDCPRDWLVLNDLWLEVNNTTFQIDSLLITPKTIYSFEVKNLEGDYYLENEKWRSRTTRK